MATYTTRREPLVTCPYNPAHQVKSGRYQIHITKCRKSYPEKDMKQCPFSAEHVVPSSELMHHINTCPLNTTVQRFLTATEKDAPSGNVVVPTCSTSEEFPTEENWDNEVGGLSGTLEEKIVAPAVTPVFANVQSMAPAQRRHYYASLHSKADELLPEDMKPKVEVKEEPRLEIPRQPTTQPKILQHLEGKQFLTPWNKVVAAGCDESEDESSEEEGDEEDKMKARRMGLGRGFTASKTNGASTPGPADEEVEDEVQSRMKLLGLGRGRSILRK